MHERYGGTAYLAILEAINEALLKRGFTEKELPDSIGEYRKVFTKVSFLPSAIYNVHAVKDYLRAEKMFINKLKYSLTRRPMHHPASEKMYVNVINGLATLGITISNKPEAPL